MIFLLLLMSLSTIAYGQLPDWLSRDTQLCYEWLAEGDPGQCSAPSNRLCANVNERTAYYRDDSDSRRGGCQMKWGIFSPNSPDWFKNVQVCFRWYAEADRAQCGDQSGRGEVCANVGSFTPSYRDDSDRRNGGCRMSWRLKVPAYAPAWMLNTKLCLDWYAEDDANQCGGPGVANNLCAAANYWTPYYRDDSDGRSGGCQMSWSFLSN